MKKNRNLKQTIAKDTAIKVIGLAKKNLHFFKGKSACRNAIASVIKKYYYDNYDVKFFYPLMKPYILKEKEMALLSEESWLAESNTQKSQDQSRVSLAERMKKSLDRAGDNYYCPN